MEARLKAEIWVKAYLRRIAVAGLFATVVRHGDDSAGIILLKINNLSGGFQVLSPNRRGDGTRIWLRANGNDWVDEANVDDYIARQAKFDSDLWVVEVEDREGRHFLDDPVD